MKSNLSIGELAEIVGGRLRLGSMPPLGGEMEPVGRLAIDSSALRPGEVYWGLGGAGSDATCAAQEALARGAAGLVVAGRRVEPWAGTFTIEVDDAKWALWQLARAVRSKQQGRFVAITGRLGKTTTAHMIDTVLASSLRGNMSIDNAQHANIQHVGLALELTALDEENDYTLCELHGRDSGELSTQAQLCRPQIAVVAPLVGEDADHAASDAAAELLAKLPQDGWAVLCGDDQQHRRLGAANHANTMWVGRGADCDIVASDVRSTNGRLSFLVDGHRLRLPVWGRHHLFAALAACAVGRLMDLPWEQIARSLTHMRTPVGRCQVASCADVFVIDDSFCATRQALDASLEVLRDGSTAERRIVVLGELAELNEAAARQAGAAVVEVCGADRLIACGKNAGDVVAGAQAAGMRDAAAQAFASIPAARESMIGAIQSGDALLAAGGPTDQMQYLIRQVTQPTSDAPGKRDEQSITNIFEVPPLVSVLRETGAALPPGLEQ